ncbi:dienelactone hydrolase family protein [Teichococcus aestuarii]|uniref:Carboxymethylenebutenolidase n=1 Tax=Teichococcus aestuarii TaxID=568898 RepID=A0A2U1V5L4_9PROT|nr:dienelactone hydrolase family protein [Pseudoroseomonas aestuarii]PWC29173.1 carboxymethylenebutenolidase [Pseudoroseomonas aestuarii]
MHPALCLLAALLLLSLPVPPAAGQEAASLPGRIELHAIPSRTLSDAEFLRGEAGAGQAVTTAGELRLPPGQTAWQAGRLPVAVLMHGSGGIDGGIEAWARLLNAEGLATFVIDGFTARGLVATNTDQAKLGRLNLILDLYGALEVLARHPRVDPERIVLIGFSRGGKAALYAATERFHRLWNRSGIGFAAYLAFYPDCSARYRDDTRMVARPIRLFHGEADDYTLARSCAAQVARMREGGADIALATYPGAHHGFDSPLSDAPGVATHSQTLRACVIEEREPGRLVNAATGAPFAYSDDCVQRNPHGGGQPEARAAVRQAVLEEVRAALAK